MPPKRKRQNSNAGLAPGEKLKRQMLPGDVSSPWAWVGTEVHSIQDIREEHYFRAIGLSSQSRHSVCHNKYAPKPVISEHTDDEIIELTDGDDAPLCSKTHCRLNPNCLNYLGQDKWESQDKSHTLFLKLANLGDNPLLDGREPNMPTGLKNLGATCFANACIQVWFQDLSFRSGVYQCLPSPNAEEKFEESPIFQLQVTFAALSHSAKNVFNPQKLVESLKLRTTEQQDAQEFSKLFMSHLDAEFQKQPIPRLRSLISDQFQGKQVYGTQCQKCHKKSERPSDFLELEITFEADAKLEDRISVLLQKETLSGDNQYLCSHCDSLQDATRYTQLRQLPPVLHFSLLRFTYDFETMERKKSKHVVSFPKTLDMRRFMDYGEDKDDKETDIYDLRGILLHKGSSAYHGHYEAQALDVSTSTWFQFNDEIVTKITHLGDKPVKKTVINVDNEDDGSSGNARKKRTTYARKRQIVQDSDDDDSSTTANSTKSIDITSKDAYMLIYARRECQDVQLNKETAEVEPPPRALDVVNSLNDIYEQECEYLTAQEALVKTAFLDVRRKVLDIYRSWCADGERSIVVSKQALESFFANHAMQSALNQISPSLNSPGSSPPPKSSDTQDTKVSTSTLLSLEDILCEHGMLDPTPSSRGNMRRISQTAYDKVVNNTRCEFEARLRTVDACKICVAEIFTERLYQIQHPLTVTQFESLDPPTGGNDDCWVSKEWLRDWKTQKPKMHNPGSPDPSPGDPEYDSRVRCIHGSLGLAHTTMAVRMSAEAGIFLKELFPTWDPLCADVEPCAICQSELYISQEGSLEIRKAAEVEKARLKSMFDNGLNGNLKLLDDIPCAVVPTEFVTAWRNWVLKAAKVPRPSALDNTIFICQHDMLNFDPNLPGDLDDSMVVIRRSDWDFLENQYAAGPLIEIQKINQEYKHPTATCTDCRKKKKSDYETCTITIRILGPKDTVSKVDDPEPSEVIKGGRQVRQSKRLRDGKQSSKKKLKINKHTTLLAIKVMLQNDLTIPTICQRLFTMAGEELTDNTATAESLSILANDVLDLKQEEEGDFASDSDEHPRKRTKSREEERGFGGTLLGSSSKPASSNPSSSPPPPEEKPCSTCTFANSLDAHICEICAAVFPCTWP